MFFFILELWLYWIFVYNTVTLAICWSQGISEAKGTLGDAGCLKGNN
jgi:hypothetical protein